MISEGSRFLLNRFLLNQSPSLLWPLVTVFDDAGKWVARDESGILS